MENAANVSLTNSWDSQSKRRPSSVSIPRRQPMNSMITAKIGTPRMKAAKFRWICEIDPDDEPRADVREGPVRHLLLLLGQTRRRQARDRQRGEQDREEAREAGHAGP